MPETQEQTQKRQAARESQTDARSEVGRIIIRMFNDTNNLQAGMKEIIDACSEYDPKLVRNRITALIANHTLEVDPSGGKGHYKYRLTQPDVKNFVGPMQPPEPSVPMQTVTVQEIPEGTKGKKSKVVWDDGERMVLAHEVASIREQQKFINLGTALEMAQRACLPVERHRIPIVHIKSQAPWLVDMVDLIAKQRPTQPEPTEPQPEQMALEDYSVGQLVDALIDKLSDRLKRSVMEIITSPEVIEMFQTTHIARSPAPRHNPVPVALESGVKLQRIVIAGLLKPAQVEEVKDKFGSKFDIRFYHPDESTHKLKGMVPSADRVMLMANMVSHKHEDALKATNVKFEKIRGGIGVLLARLSELNIIH